MKFKHSQRVARWAEPGENGKSPIDVALEDSETAALAEPVVLALIAVESMGNEWAHRDKSQFYGLLQMGHYAGLDVGLEDCGRHTTKPLSGNGLAALVAFVAYVNRYADRVWDADSVATLWKGGPGTAQDLLDLVDDGKTFDEAVSEKDGDIKNLTEYLRRFRGFLEVYS